MAHITAEGFEVCMAFGAASLAVSEAAEHIARSNPISPTNDLFVELKSAHSQLRVLFAQGFDNDVLVLATNIVELANRTVSAYEEEEQRTGLWAGQFPFLLMDYWSRRRACLRRPPADRASVELAQGLHSGKRPSGV